MRAADEPAWHGIFVGWMSFALGIVCGYWVCRAWSAVERAWSRANRREIAELELPIGAVPRALIRSDLDLYYVRQLAPSRRASWFREDTGDPVSEDLDQRLHVLLAMAFSRNAGSTQRLGSLP